MPVFAFRARGSPALYGAGTAAEASRYESLLNRDRAINLYSANRVTDGEAALNSGRTSNIKQQIIRISLGKKPI